VTVSNLNSVSDLVANAPTTHRRRPGPALVAGAAILILVVVLGTWMSIKPPYSPLESVADPMLGPNAHHWLGTDNVGRDTLVRLALAGRSSLLISGGAAAIAAFFGTVLGVIAGYAGGLTDAIIMRIVDAVLSIPAMLVALVVGVVIGTGPWPLIIALGGVFTPVFARVARAPVLELRERDFVLAAKLNGVSPLRIAVTHLLPNCLTPLLIQFASVASIVVLLEATLSYLGQGVQAPAPSAGRMISEFTRFMQTQPLLVVLPTLMIILLSAGWNLLADGIRVYFAPRRDPGLPGSRRAPSITRRPQISRTAQNRSPQEGNAR
jgi:peptide/nickel transport system permease protein